MNNTTKVEHISKLCCTHTMEYYSATRRTELLMYAAKWISLKIIKGYILNEPISIKLSYRVTEWRKVVAWDLG